MNDMGLLVAGDAPSISGVVCQVSALMSTYANETHDHLAESLESLFAQSLPPDQLVLVIDGSIGRDQEEVIARYQADARIHAMDLVRLPTNQGLANALNAGLAACTGEWIMRMDSDDISHPERLAVQLDYLAKYPDVDVFSSWCYEFIDGENRRQIKASSIHHSAIVKALRWRNVLVHPTTLMRSAALRDIGGYRAKFGKLEDYDLFVRLALSEAIFRVIPMELLSVRTSRAQRGRRGGLRYTWGEIRFRVFCLRAGFLTIRQFLIITSAYTVFRLAGSWMRSWLYRFARTNDTIEAVRVITDEATEASRVS